MSKFYWDEHPDEDPLSKVARERREDGIPFPREESEHRFFGMHEAALAEDLEMLISDPDNQSEEDISYSNEIMARFTDHIGWKIREMIANYPHLSVQNQLKIVEEGDRDMVRTLLKRPDLSVEAQHAILNIDDDEYDALLQARWIEGNADASTSPEP